VSFADPREGDIEDDASSTSRHSLLAHAGTMLLDTSLPKLAIALVQALVIPGLVLGAAPVAALWFLQQVWWRLPTEANLAWLSLFLAVDAWIVWRFGPRLFRLVERNFWALNAALVQPLFMAVREAVRQVMERRLARGAPDPDRLARRRIWAGLLAGLLIAAVGAVVALAVGPLPRWFAPITVVEDVPLFLRDALANGIWAVAAYLAVAAPAWSLGEAIAGAPRDLPPAPESVPDWRIAHLSDIHLVGEEYGFRLECGRDGPRGNARFEAAMAALEATGARAPLDLVLVTGDVTDAGRNAEFIAFADAMRAHPSLAARTLILPGNHDLNIVDRASPARLELPSSPGPWIRRLRMLAAMEALQGGRVRVMAPDRRRVGPTLSDFLSAEGRGAAMAAFLDDGRAPRGGPHPRAVWEACFPMVVPPATPDGLGVLLCDSNALTHFSFTNALGILAAQEWHAAEHAMAEWPRARWLVCLHHHLVEYPKAGVKLADRIATALTNGHWVIARLRRQAARLVVLHGHRHTDWTGEVGGVRILSAPSPMMGDADPASARYFWIQQLARGEGGALALLAAERVEVAGEAGPTLAGSPPSPNPLPPQGGEGFSVAAQPSPNASP
jgi:hypothetical protein